MSTTTRVWALFAVVSITISGLLMNESHADFAVPAGFKGIRIQLNESASAKGRTVIDGLYSTFTPCGSQYATWFQFPWAIRYEVRDLDSNAVYLSLDQMLSISHDGNQVYDEYAKKPCDQIVSKTFQINVEDIPFIGSPPGPLKNIEIRAMYYDDASNALRIKRSIVLKRF